MAQRSGSKRPPKEKQQEMFDHSESFYASIRFEAINSAEAKSLEGGLHWPTAPVSKDRLQREQQKPMCVCRYYIH